MEGFEYTTGATKGAIKAGTIKEAFRKVLDKLYGRSCGWQPIGRQNSGPDYCGWVRSRGYVTRRSRKANVYSFVSPLLMIKIRPATKEQG